MQRTAKIKRSTKETDISIELNLDGSGIADLDCPIGFLNHMLNTFAVHGLFDITLKAKGDLEVDQHHLVEDIGIVLGQCFKEALGDKQGIRRVGSCLYPMDETLARAAVDFCGRAFLVFDALLTGIPLVSQDGTFQTDTIADFWQGFAMNAGCALHLDILRGRSDHHKIEAMFKAAARTFRDACEIDPRAAMRIPSAKGVIV
ncbi:MAG: imidazoleglycerol-phosphate dehydratase HisB [Treponema sp.]|jgi:imidazoleglycerol-phosphate dehydratase|nr:imidazoleglycerol-phosphate dehydratase HisB [Treponema sp.]